MVIDHVLVADYQYTNCCLLTKVIPENEGLMNLGQVGIFVGCSIKWL